VKTVYYTIFLQAPFAPYFSLSDVVNRCD